MLISLSGIGTGINNCFVIMNLTVGLNYGIPRKEMDDLHFFKF